MKHGIFKTEWILVLEREKEMESESEGGRQAGKERKRNRGGEIDTDFLTLKLAVRIWPLIAAPGYFLDSLHIFLSKHEKKASLVCIDSTLHITFVHVQGFINAQG